MRDKDCFIEGRDFKRDTEVTEEDDKECEIDSEVREYFSYIMEKKSH